MVSQNFDEVGLEAIIRGVGTYAANAGKLVTSNKAINASLNLAAKTAGKFQKALSTAMKVGALAVAAGIVASVLIFANFDKAMTESIAIMGDVSAAMREDMEVAARDVAKATTFSMSQAAESYFFLASAGLDAAQSIAALPKVATFAQAGMFDMALATDLLTDAQSALGLTVEDTVQNVKNMVRVSDVLVKANTLANATVQQFSEALTREAGAAIKSFNKDVEEGVAVLAAFADQGIKGQVAGTSLSRILRLMGSAAVNSSDAYEKFNVRVFDSTGNMRNLADIIEDLENALLGLSDEARIAALEQLGFQARVQGVILPLLGTSDAIREYEAGLRSAGGITEEVAEKQLTSLGAQFSLLRSGIEDLLFTIGKGLEPVLRSFVRTLREDVIPWVEVRLPIALEKARQLFEDWKPALVESAKAVNDLRESVVAFGSWIIRNEAALVGAIVAIGVAFAWTNPAFGIAAGIGAIIIVIGLLRADVDKLGESALEARIQILKLGLAVAKFVDFLQFIPDVDSPFGKFTIDIPDASNAVRDFEVEIGILEQHLDSVRVSIDATDRTIQGLSDTLAESEDAFILVKSASGDLTFVLPRARVEADLLAQAWQEVARQGPEVEAAMEIIAASIVATRGHVRDLTAEMLNFAAVQVEINRLLEAGGPQTALELFRQIDRILSAIPDEFPSLIVPPIAPPGIGGGAAAAGEGLSEAFLKGIVDGIRRGTITILDAMDFLRRGMVNAASAIVVGLLAEANRIETRLEVIADTVEQGFLTLQDLARLVDVGAFGAARGLADQFPVIDEAVWERAIARWLNTVAEGVREGTITVVDAIEFLERGMINAARSIVDALVEEQFRVATQFEVMADIIARGFATVADAQRLIDIGAMEEALLILQTIAGEETEILDLIAQANKERFRLAFPEQFSEQPIRERLKILFPDLFPEQSFKEGGFVPAGQTVKAVLHGPEAIIPLAGGTKVATQLAIKTLALGQIKLPSISMQEGGFIPAGTTAQATLHGPELVVPLGGNTMALRALTRALQGVPGGGSNEGFRNFGNVNVFADGNSDDLAMRSITRALGV